MDKFIVLAEGVRYELLMRIVCDQDRLKVEYNKNIYDKDNEDDWVDMPWAGWSLSRVLVEHLDRFMSIQKSTFDYRDYDKYLPYRSITMEPN